MYILCVYVYNLYCVNVFFYMGVNGLKIVHLPNIITVIKS
jgi:hypothetical protein